MAVTLQGSISHQDTCPFNGHQVIIFHLMPKHRPWPGSSEINLNIKVFFFHDNDAKTKWLTFFDTIFKSFFMQLSEKMHNKCHFLIVMK